MCSIHRPSLCVLMQLLVLLVGVAPALAGQVQLAWDAPDLSTPLAGYALSYWQEPAGVPHSVDVGPQTTYTLDDLMDGATYSFSVSCYDTDGNVSDESDIVTVTMPSDLTLGSPPPATQR